jgi:hypothetical protein
MYKNLLISIGIILLIVVALFFAANNTSENPMQGGGYLTGFPIFGTASTSPDYLATSTDPLTYEIGLGDSVNNISLLSNINASSTDSEFNYVFYTSYDGIDWYDMEQATSTTASSTKFIDIGAINNKYLKIELSRTENHSGGAVYTEAIIKSSY